MSTAYDAPIGNFRVRLAPKSTPQHKRFYGTRRWKRLRRVVLAEHPVCEHCGRAFAVDVDHVDGDNRNNQRCNLQALCKECHGRKTKLHDTP